MLMLFYYFLILLLVTNKQCKVSNLVGSVADRLPCKQSPQLATSRLVSQIGIHHLVLVPENT